MDNLGTTFGRIHIGAQNINRIQTRKMKGLRKTFAEKKAGIKRKNIENNNSVKRSKASSDTAN